MGFTKLFALLLLLFTFTHLAMADSKCIRNRLRAILGGEEFAPIKASAGAFAQLSSGREMYYVFHRGQRGKPTYVIIHGLGDNLEKLNAMTENLERAGFGTFRVDLHGHGKTLQKYLETHEHAPDLIDYREQVQDVAELIVRAGIKRNRLFGHSMGGQIVFNVAQNLPKEFRPESIHMAAPYVYRLDGYLRESALDGRMWLNASTRFLRDFFGIPSPFADLMMSPMRTTLNMNRGTMQVLNRGGVVDQITRFRDTWIDFQADSVVSAAFRNAFLKYDLKKTEFQLSKTERRFLNERVRAALAATKGIRDFNVFSPDAKFPPNIPIQLLIGEGDQLVLEDELDEFAQVMEHKKYPFETVKIPGTHFFPQTNPEQVTHAIMMFGQQH